MMILIPSRYSAVLVCLYLLKYENSSLMATKLYLEITKSLKILEAVSIKNKQPK